MKNATKKNWIQGFYLFVCIQLVMFIYLDVNCPNLNIQESAILSEFQKIEDPTSIEGKWFKRGVRNSYGLVVDAEFMSKNFELNELKNHYQTQVTNNKWDVLYYKEDERYITYKCEKKNMIMYIIIDKEQTSYSIYITY